MVRPESGLCGYIKDGNHHIKIITSDVDFRVREEGEGKMYTRFGNQYGTKEKAKEAKLEQQLKGYYRNVFDALHETDEVYIFGPAEAKNELNKLISAQTNGTIKVSAIASSGKLTENQIIAAVKKHFNV